MKGFIEVTGKNSGNKVLIAVSKIMFIDYDNDSVYVVFQCKMERRNRVRRGIIEVTETYEEVKRLIEQAIV